MSLSDICEDVLQTIFQQSYQRFVVVLRTTWILVLKGALNLGCKTSRILVLGTLRIRLQNDGSVNVFKSSYTSWRPVLKTGHQDVFTIPFLPIGWTPLQMRSFNVFLTCAWTNGWTISGIAGDLRRYDVHCDVTVMMGLSYTQKRTSVVGCGLWDKHYLPKLCLGWNSSG